MRVVAVSNEKGGVGKSLTAFHAAHFLAERGAKRVLVVDLDQQDAALSAAMPSHASTVSALDLFAAPIAVPSTGPITLAPRTRELENVERQDAREMIETFLASIAIAAQTYDYLVLDTPPAFGSRTFAAIAAADHVVCPIELNESSLDAVQFVVDALARVRVAFDRPPLDLARNRPLLVSRYSTHSPRQRALFEELAARVGRIVLDGAVVSRDAYARFRAEQKPVWDMRDARGAVSASIKAASDEMRGVLGQVERAMAA